MSSTSLAQINMPREVRDESNRFGEDQSSGVGPVRDRIEAGELSIEGHLDELKRGLRTALGKIDQFMEFDEWRKREMSKPITNGVEMIINTTFSVDNENIEPNLINTQQDPIVDIPGAAIINLEESRVERRDASTQTEDEQTVDFSLRVERRDPGAQETQTVDVVEEEGLQEASRTTATRSHNDGREGEDGNNERRDADGVREEGQPGVQGATETPDPIDHEVINIPGYPNPPSNGEVSNFIVNPDSRLYRFWSYFIIILTVCSSFFTPLEFAFFMDLPGGLLYIIDLVVAFFFFMDLLVQFFIPYRDDQADRMVYRHRSIAFRYLKAFSTYLNLLGCCPWDVIYAVCWRNERVRYILWIRLYRVSKVVKFFQNIEINKYLRILKHSMILYYYIHTAGCIFYYLATIVPDSCEGYTWLGSLVLGEYSYSHFRQIGFGRRYLISLYFALVTMSTVGYGDVHAVSAIEMIFTMIYISLSMVVLPYWVSSALMVSS